MEHVEQRDLFKIIHTTVPVLSTHDVFAVFLHICFPTPPASDVSKNVRPGYRNLVGRSAVIP